MESVRCLQGYARRTEVPPRFVLAFGQEHAFEPAPGPVHMPKESLYGWGAKKIAARGGMVNRSDCAKPCEGHGSVHAPPAFPAFDPA